VSYWVRKPATVLGMPKVSKSQKLAITAVPLQPGGENAKGMQSSGIHGHRLEIISTMLKAQTSTVDLNYSGNFEKAALGHGAPGLKAG